MKHVISSARLLVCALCIGALTACGSLLSGIGGSSSLSCPLGPGGTCQSMRSTYQEAISGNFKKAESATNTPAPIPDYASGDRSMGAVMASISAERKEANSGLSSTKSSSPVASKATQLRDRAVPNSGVPVRSESQMLRIWFAPFEDDEGVLRDQSYSYAVIDTGRWLIEHNQKRIQNQYGPITAPAPFKPATAATANTPLTPLESAARAGNTMPDGAITRSLGITTPANPKTDVED